MKTLISQLAADSFAQHLKVFRCASGEAEKMMLFKPSLFGGRWHAEGVTDEG